MRAFLLLFGLVLLPVQSGTAAEDALTTAARRNFSEYLELLAIPNVPDKPDDMRRNSAFLEKAFQKRGFSTRLLDNPAGRPQGADRDVPHRDGCAGGGGPEAVRACQRDPGQRVGNFISGTRTLRSLLTTPYGALPAR